MEKVAVYARVSTGRQEKEETIETQLMVVRDYCAEHDYDATEYLDEGHSGITLDLEERPAGARLMEAAQNGRDFDKVIVYKRDRLGRGLPAALAQRTFDKLGIEVISVTEPHTRQKIGRKTSDYTSDIYAEVVTENTINGRIRAARAGRWPTSIIPYGYDRKDGKLIENPVTADVVRRMFDMADEGAGIVAIATRLNAAGIESPRVLRLNGQIDALKAKEPVDEERIEELEIQRDKLHDWQGAGLWRMLTHERYKGKTFYGPVEIEIPRLISDDQFDRVIAGLRKRRDDAPKRTKRVYLLQHLLKCRACGGNLMSRVYSRGIRRYMCSYRAKYGAKNGGHDGVVWHIDASEAEQAVIKAINDFMSNPKDAADAIEVYTEQADAANKAAAVELPGLEKRVDDLAMEERRLVKAVAKGTLGDAMVREMREEIDKARADVEARMVALKQGTDFDVKQLRIDAARALVDKLRAHKGKVPGDKITSAMDTPSLFKAYIRSFLDTIWLEKDGNLTIEGPVSVSQQS